MAMTLQLHDDLVVGILVRLDVKSLLRLRCVCKLWLNLIKSPTFINMHLKYHSLKKEYILEFGSTFSRETFATMSLRSYESLSIISSQPLQVPELFHVNFDVYGPCNGLICISDRRIIVLCNPAMREFKVLHPCPSVRPLFMMSVIGFGFDSTTNDYKVITLSCSHRTSLHKVDVYSLSTNSWREINYDYKSDHLWPHYGAELNGAYHWISSFRDGNVIVFFNITTEAFHEFEFPDEHKHQCSSRISVMVLNESLALFVRAEPNTVQIWLMNEYGVTKSWTKEFIIRCSVLGRPLLFWKDLSLLIESSRRKIENNPMAQGGLHLIEPMEADSQHHLIESFGKKLVMIDRNSDEGKDIQMNGVFQNLALMTYQESLISIK